LRPSTAVSDKPDDGLIDKVDAIRKFYDSTSDHPDVRALAEDLSFNKAKQLDIEGFFSKLKSLVRYLPDPTGRELIKAPWVMVSEIHERGFTTGDCDDLASLSYSLLHSVGIGAALYVGWYDGSSVPSHIFVGVPTVLGGYTPFDLVAEKYGQTKGGRTHVEAYP
jgi:hypothetical protein